MSDQAVFPCDWFDEHTRKPCATTCVRRFNLECHVRETHERRDSERHASLIASLPLEETDGNCRVIRVGEAFCSKLLLGLHRKSDVHAVLLPNPPRPFSAITTLLEPDFWARLRAEAQQLKSTIASELRRRYSSLSHDDRPREAILSGEVEAPDGEPLPIGRNWERDLKVGVRADSCGSQLYVHVLSPDMCSPGVLHKNHYNAFMPPFFINLDDLPLDGMKLVAQARTPQDMRCWRCGMSFNYIGSLKDHLATEFESWKRE